MGWQSWSAWPKGGDYLGSGALHTVNHPMRRLETSFYDEELFGKGPRGIGRDFYASQPSLLAASLDGLAYGTA